MIQELSDGKNGSVGLIYWRWERVHRINHKISRQDRDHESGGRQCSARLPSFMTRHVYSVSQAMTCDFFHPIQICDTPCNT